MSAAGGAMVGIMIGRNLALLQEGCLAVETGWAPLVERGFALSFAPAGPLVPLPRGRPRLAGRHGGVDCTVEVRSDAVHYAETVVEARGTAAYALGVWGSRGGPIGRLRDWIHGDVKVGDEAFDERFLVTAKPPEAAVRVLGPAAREQISILAAGRFSSLSVADGLATVVLAGVESEADTLEVALALAASLVRG